MKQARPIFCQLCSAIRSRHWSALGAVFSLIVASVHNTTLNEWPLVWNRGSQDANSRLRSPIAPVIFLPRQQDRHVAINASSRCWRRLLSRTALSLLDKIGRSCDFCCRRKCHALLLALNLL